MVTSPEYSLVFTAPGCPELDSVSPSVHFWGGPGKSEAGGINIVIVEGRFESHLKNVLDNDLGEDDFYTIQVVISAGSETVPTGGGG